MTQNKIKQHIVPQGYLRNFTTTNGKLFVFDKKTKQEFTTGTGNVANERFFYDLPSQYTNKIGEDHQYVENRLAKIEGELLPIIGAALIRVQRYKMRKPIKAEHKNKLTKFLLIQFLRTRTQRDVLREIIKYAEETVPSTLQNSSAPFRIKANEINASFIQSRMLFEPENIAEALKILNDHICIIGYNETKMPLYTSDHPVVLRPHKDDALHNYSGLGVEGIEITLPLSPKCNITLYERRFHKQWRSKDLQVVNLTVEQVNDYNILQLAQCGKQIYSNSGDFSLVKAVWSQYQI